MGHLCLRVARAGDGVRGHERLELGHLGGRQRAGQRAEHVVELLPRARADQRDEARLTGERPGDADLRRGAVAGLGERAEALDDLLVAGGRVPEKRLGLSDDNEGWILPALLRVLDKEAPRMRLIALPVQFRTVSDALVSRRVDAAVTVADELPSSIRRRALFTGGFVCLFDPRHARLRRAPSETEYFAREHVIVSYAGDLRGVVEDMLRKTRRVRCSVSSFHHVGAIIEGTSMLATVPAVVAEHIRKARPHLKTARLPIPLGSAPMELLWSAADDDDPAGQFVRENIVRVVKAAVRG